MGNDDGVEGHQLSTSTSPRSLGQSMNMSTPSNNEVVDHSRTPKWLSDDSNPIWSPEWIKSSEDSHNGQPKPEEILRRLSLTDELPRFSSRTQARKEYAGLGLSGNIISATFCVPYRIEYGNGGEWVESGSTDCYEPFITDTIVGVKTTKGDLCFVRLFFVSCFRGVIVESHPRRLDWRDRSHSERRSGW